MRLSLGLNGNAEGLKAFLEGMLTNNNYVSVIVDEYRKYEKNIIGLDIRNGTNFIFSVLYIS